VYFIRILQINRSALDKKCAYCGTKIIKDLTISMKDWSKGPRFCNRKCFNLSKQQKGFGYLSNYLEQKGITKAEAINIFPLEETLKTLSHHFNKGFTYKTEVRTPLMWLLTVATLNEGTIGDFEWRMLYRPTGDISKWVDMEQGFKGSMLKWVFDGFDLDVEEFIGFARSQYMDYYNKEGNWYKDDSLRPGARVFEVLKEWGKDNDVFKRANVPLGETVLRLWLKKKRSATPVGLYWIAEVMSIMLGYRIDWRMMLPVYYDKDLLLIEKTYLNG